MADASGDVEMAPAASQRMLRVCVSLSVCLFKTSRRLPRGFLRVCVCVFVVLLFLFVSLFVCVCLCVFVWLCVGGD